MHVEMTAGGKLLLLAPQQKWSDGQGGDESVMQVARFAGQEMMAIANESSGFELRFLGFKTGDFATMEEAKDDAPEFAKYVFARMTEMVV